MSKNVISMGQMVVDDVNLLGAISLRRVLVWQDFAHRHLFGL